jgi:hypothetical protein
VPAEASLTFITLSRQKRGRHPIDQGAKHAISHNKPILQEVSP